MNPSSNPSPHLLTLPYDIRHLIYTHLFPSNNNKLIYIQAHPRQSLHIINTSPSTPCVALNLLLTSRLLNSEASAYLYNTYIFHIVGQKQDCLAGYTSLERTIHKHAIGRGEVYVHALSNGLHSRTGAILLHMGKARVEDVRRRGRGVRVSLEGLRGEVEDADGCGEGRWSGLRRELRRNWREPLWWAWMVGMCAVVVVAVVWS